MTTEGADSQGMPVRNDLLIQDEFVFPHPSMIRHVDTRSSPTPRGFFQGETKWSCRMGHVEAIVAWSWIELRPGVVMLSDPNSVESNIRFLQSPGQPATRGQTLILLNTIIHSLDWQSTVKGLIPVRLESPTRSLSHH